MSDADREPTVTLLGSVWGAIEEVCTDLDEEQWARPTDCPGWTVRDQLAHMIGTESLLLGEAAPDGPVPELEHVRNEIGRANEQWVASMRSSPGSAVLAAFHDVTRRRLEALRGLSSDQWDEEGFTPEGPGPYRTFMDIRVFDCWFHEQDVREALDRPGDLEGPVADHAIGRITPVLPYIVGKRAAAPQGATVVLALSGAHPAEHAVMVEGRARLLDVVPESPTVRLDLDRRTYTRLAGGRWSGDRAFDEGHVSIAGDVGLGRRIVDRFGYTI